MSTVTRRRNVASSQTVRRRQAERLQLLEDQLVDEVLRRRQIVDRHAERNRRAEHADVPLIAGHDGDAAGQLAGRDQAA